MRNQGKLTLRSDDDKKPTITINKDIAHLFPKRGVYYVSMRIEVDNKEVLNQGLWYHSDYTNKRLRAKEWNTNEFPLPAIPAKNGGIPFKITKADQVDELEEKTELVERAKLKKSGGAPYVVVDKDDIAYSKVYPVESPVRAHSTDAGIDFFIPEFSDEFIKEFFKKNVPQLIDLGLKEIIIGPGEKVNIPSGIKMNVPDGWAVIIFNKSGVASILGLDVMACVIDSDYQGVIHLNLVNTSNTATVTLEPGKKITQGILLPVGSLIPKEVPFGQLYEDVTDRGDGGFGHTDKK